MTSTVRPDRHAVIRRGNRLVAATLAYNSLEAVGALVAGVLAGSVALVGFGVDSVIELASSLAALWRLSRDADAVARHHADRLTLRLVGLSFVALSAYVAIDAARTLYEASRPAISPFGLAIAAGSVVVMPLLARAKRQVAAQLRSAALTAEARQTDICFYLSLILLAGLALNAVLGWWWADPVAGLVIVVFLLREAVEALRGEDDDD